MRTPKSPAPDSTAVTRRSPPILTSREIFQGGPEVLIEHEGECYRLRLTRHGKLILTK
ncbi:MAG: hemin uptake protein HemP [Pseudomonadales bacterium]|nr:hemin uptake protein HemP [Pseudomonadales bacterium]